LGKGYQAAMIATYRKSFPYITPIFLLWGDEAGKLLTINRNGVKYEAENLLSENLHEVLLEYFRALEVDKVDETLLAYISAYIQLCEKKEDFPKISDQWKDIYLTKEPFKTFKELRHWIFYLPDRMSKI